MLLDVVVDVLLAVVPPPEPELLTDIPPEPAVVGLPPPLLEVGPLAPPDPVRTGSTPCAHRVMKRRAEAVRPRLRTRSRCRCSRADIEQPPRSTRSAAMAIQIATPLGKVSTGNVRRAPDHDAAQWPSTRRAIAVERMLLPLMMWAHVVQRGSRPIDHSAALFRVPSKNVGSSHCPSNRASGGGIMESPWLSFGLRLPVGSLTTKSPTNASVPAQGESSYTRSPITMGPRSAKRRALPPNPRWRQSPEPGASGHGGLSSGGLTDANFMGSRFVRRGGDRRLLRDTSAQQVHRRHRR